MTATQAPSPDSIRVLAEQALGDPDAAALFKQQLGIEPQAFAALADADQQAHLASRVHDGTIEVSGLRYLVKALDESNDQWGVLDTVTQMYWSGEGWQKPDAGLASVMEHSEAAKLSQEMHKNLQAKMLKITVHEFSGWPAGQVYDRTQTDDSIKDGDVLDLGGGNVAILVEAWPTVVAGEIEGFHRLAVGVNFETLDDGKYAPSVAKAREVSSKLLTHGNVPQAVFQPKGGATDDAQMAQAMHKLFLLDESVIHDRIGPIVVASSEDPAHKRALYCARAGAMAYHYASTTPESSGMTVFFKDRIPSGIEERVILREMFQLQAIRVDTTARLFLVEATERWDSWGASKGSAEEAATEREIFQAVEKRIETLRKNSSLPSTRLETQFAFAVQETVKRGIEPDVNGKGASGWLHEVIEHVKYTVKHTMGFDLQKLEPSQLVEITRLDDPFVNECKKMRGFEIAQRQREESQALEERQDSGLLVSDMPEMETGELGWPVSKTVLGYYESGDPVLVVFERPDDDFPDKVRIRTVDSEGWDVTARIVEWVDVPARPTRAVERGNEESPAPGM